MCYNYNKNSYGEVIILAVFELDNAISIGREGEPYKFNTTLSAATLATLFENNIIEYKGELQRGTKVLKSGKVKDVFSLKHVKEILEAMLQNKIHGGMITFNYDKDNETPMYYDKDNNTIMIENDEEVFEEPLFQIIDGQHRIRACQMWAELYQNNPEAYPNPKLFEYPVTIEYLSSDRAKSLFAEYTLKGLKISRTRGEYLNVEDMSNKISRKVMNESELKGKIELISTSVKGKNSIVTFAILSQSIKENYKPATNKEADKIAKYLIEYFDELVELFPEYLGNMNINSRNEARKKSFILEPLAFYGIVSLSNQLMKIKDWQEQLKKLRQEVTVGKWKGEFLDKKNPLWNSVFREGDKIINNTSTQAFMTKAISQFVLEDIPADQIA